MTDYKKLKTFCFENQNFGISYKEPVNVAKGVTCHVYEFQNDESRDLGIIEVEPGCKTPLQKVVLGDKTIEGYFSGKGALTVVNSTGQKKCYNVGESAREFSVSVAIGELMQWQSAPYVRVPPTLADR